ncbi:MAG TPA: aldo/keto reductase [Gemmatimonadaceae bacterium]|jgi:aryl-alcohol dehydrogenase-like predicted oxidoreductase
MQRRHIGSLEVSIVGLGGNNFGRRLDADATARVVHAALDAGVTFFDTAELYGDGLSEQYLGRALRVRRRDAIIATKFGHKSAPRDRRGQPANVRRAADASLQRLGTDYIDLFQLHSPDSTTPIAETLGALDELVRAGKVREVGCSNFSVDQIREAEHAVQPGHARSVSVQNEYSLIHREPEADVLPECERRGLAFIPYFPLASGLLTGKYRKDRPVPKGTRLAEGNDTLSDENLSIVEELVHFAESRKHTLLELSFAWLLAHPMVSSVIAGATKPEQIRANAAAADWKLSAEERAAVDALAVYS